MNILSQSVRTKKTLIFTILLSLFFVASICEACTTPVQFMKLNENLRLEINRFEQKIPKRLNKNSKLFLEQKWSEKMVNFRNDVKKTFPPKFAQIFEDYEQNVQKIDVLFEAIKYNDTTLSEDEKSALSYLSQFHIYMLSEVLPNIVAFRKYHAFSVAKLTNQDIESQAFDIKKQLEPELTPANLKLCKDQAGIDERGLKQPKTLIKDVSSASNSFADNENVSPDAEMEIPGDGFQTDFSGDEAENSDMNMRSEEVKGPKIIGWFKDFLGLFSTKKPEEKALTSETYLKDLAYIGAHQKNLNITVRHLDWQNDRNFWVKRTRDISGKKIDFFVRKFEEITNLIEQTNEEIDKSIGDAETICQNQKAPFTCWGGSNSAPD